MRDYIEEYEGNVTAAVLAMAADLMRGDPAELKQGYTLDNALLAATSYLAPGEMGGEIMRQIGTFATAAFLLGRTEIRGI